MTPKEIATAMVDVQNKRALAEVELTRAQAYVHRCNHDVLVYDAEMRNLQAAITAVRLPSEVERITTELEKDFPEEVLTAEKDG